MQLLAHLFLTFLYFAIITYSCVLFTNAIEHLGNKLKLSSNAVGSVLAVIGTTLPETLVPLVAIIGSKFFLKNSQIGQDIALGGIFGSPFMLVCLALFLIGVEIIILKLIKKRKSLTLDIDHNYILRDFKYFLCAYIPAFFCIFIENSIIKSIIVIYLVSLYIIYISRTLLKSKQNICEECSEELIFSRIANSNYNSNLITLLIIAQIIVSLIILVIAIHYFVSEIKFFSNLFNISPIILSLIITPFATELPECINSLIWVKNGKDDLALFNINGAIVFQAIIPMSIGIVLTPFSFNNIILINSIFLITASLIFLINTIINKKVSYIPLLICGIFYFSFVFWLLYCSIPGNLS